MANRRDWLEAGLTILSELGARALTIERLTERMGLSKGSFYHHFGGMGGYVTALLAHFEAEHTTRFIEVVQQDPAAPAHVRLQRLVDLVAAEDEGPELETAIRSWALQNPEVGEAQQRVDQTRIDYLRGLWREISGDDEQADDMAVLLYLLVVGAGHVRPPIPLARVRRLYDLALRLGPGGGDPRRVTPRSAESPVR